MKVLLIGSDARAHQLALDINGVFVRFRQIANVSHRRADDVPLAEVLFYRLSFRWRLDYDKFCSFGHTLIMCPTGHKVA